MRKLKHFYFERDGSVAVEFTLVAVLMLGLVFSILETGLAFLFGLSVENATQKLARMIQTGQLQQLGVSSAADLKSKVICPANGGGLLPSFVDCGRLVVDLRSASDYGADPSLSFYRESTQFCIGSSDQIMVLRVAYGLPVFLPPLAVGMSVFDASSAGMVDDYPASVGWTHLLANAMTFQVESGASDASASSSGSTTSAAGC